MMNNDMLRNIDYLRERANVTYEEAMALLEKMEGDVMRALIELENQGRVYPKTNTNQNEADKQKSLDMDLNDVKEKAASFFHKACKTRLVIEKKHEDGEKDTIINMSAPVVAGFAFFAPHIAIASAAITLASGYQVNVQREQEDQKP